MINGASIKTSRYLIKALLLFRKNWTATEVITNGGIDQYMIFFWLLFSNILAVKIDRMVYSKGVYTENKKFETALLWIEKTLAPSTSRLNRSKGIKRYSSLLMLFILRSKIIRAVKTNK